MDATRNGESVDRSGGAVVSSRMADDQQSVGNEHSVASTEDQSVPLGDSEYQKKNHRVCSKRKRPRAEFPWSYTHDWSKGDPPRLRGKRQCVLCKKWFSPSSNAQG
jgi:hypothetical protein